ncbi:hypothetical protein ABIA24_002622 [Sinorhizobium fredii]
MLQAASGGARALPGLCSLLRTRNPQCEVNAVREDGGGARSDAPSEGVAGSGGDMQHPGVQHSGGRLRSPPCSVSEWFAPVMQSGLPTESNCRRSGRGPADAAATDWRTSIKTATSANPCLDPIRRLAIRRFPIGLSDHPRVGR